MSKNTGQSGFAKDFISEVNKKGNVKSLAGAVGMPDEKDWENIVHMIAIYRKKSREKYLGQDILVDCISTARREYKETGRDYSGLTSGFNVVNKGSNMRYHFELPESFIHMIELAYPLMFKDIKHYHWFCKNFKELMIADKF